MRKKIYRWLGGYFGYLLYTLALLVVLLWLLFPEEALRSLLVQYLNATYPELNWRVQSITRKIPEGVMAGMIEGYEAQDNKKPLVRVDRLTLRPDLVGMMKTINLQAAYRMVLAQGVIAGEVQWGGRKKGLRIDGSIQGLQLAECGMLTRLLERELQGTVSAIFSGTVLLGKISEMDVQLNITGGRLGLKQPVFEHPSLPFSRAAMIVHGRGEALQLEQGTFESELLNGQFAGKIKLAQDPVASRLDIRGTLQPQADFFKGVNNATTLRVFRSQLKNRLLPFRISGDLYNPGIHFEEFSLLFQSLEKELK